MKKQLSSVELHYLAKELEILKGSRVDKIYQPDKSTLIFSFYRANLGKKLLKVDIGKSAFIYGEKEDFGETLGFGMLLRKHLDGYFLDDVAQIEPERILKLSFKVKDDKKYLYIEFFGKGNAVLCDEHNAIINALEHHEFRDRAIKPKLKYKYPIMNYNLFDMSKNNLIGLIKGSKRESLVVCLATELGLGGVYSEEICLLSKIDKNKGPKGIEDKEVDCIFSSIKSLLNKKINPVVVMQGNNPVDAVPFDLEPYKKYEKKYFSSFSEALSFFYSHFKEAKETEHERRLKSLQRIIDEQKAAIEEMKREEQELREKGELFYHKYSLIKEILEEMRNAAKKYSWKEIKERLKGHKIVKEINEKEKKIVVEI